MKVKLFRSINPEMKRLRNSIEQGNRVPTQSLIKGSKIHEFWARTSSEHRAKKDYEKTKKAKIP